MIDRENLSYIKNILTLHNDKVDLSDVYDIISSIKDNNTLHFFNTLIEYFTDLNDAKETISSILEGIRDNDEHKFYSELLKKTNPDLDITFLKNVLLSIKQNSDIADDIFDSFSNNQIASKTALLDAVDSLNVLNSDSVVSIWGGWYGSILIPKLSPKVKKIVSIDLDETPLQIAKNRFFSDYKNIDFICDDVFSSCRKVYSETNLIINTSCEHMLPMKDWPWFGPGALLSDGISGKDPKLSENCYFAFQSNNMFGIEGHINCVNSIEEFKEQMPERAKILYEEEVEDTRGTRYMLVGKFVPINL